MFDLSELLEAILLHLAIKNILITGTRINRHWQANIKGSLKLQRASLLKPMSNTRLDLRYGTGMTAGSIIVLRSSDNEPCDNTTHRVQRNPWLELPDARSELEDKLDEGVRMSASNDQHVHFLLDVLRRACEGKLGDREHGRDQTRKS